MASATSSPAKRTSKRGRGKSASGGQDDEGATEYEKQRLSRIRENQERLEALGLRSLASALLESSASGNQGPVSKEGKAGTSRRGQKKKKGRGGNADDEDDEYRPSEEDQCDGSSSSGEEKTDEEEEGHASSPGARRRPRGKKRASSNAVKVGKKIPMQSKVDQLGDMDDDAALQQAIALSLEEPTKCSAAESIMVSQNSKDFVNTECHGKNNVNSIQETPGRGKRRKPNVNRPQMTEDELVAYFFSIDEAGKGSITVRDLMRMAVAHDFCWTDQEMVDMICLFDSNRDGKMPFLYLSFDLDKELSPKVLVAHWQSQTHWRRTHFFPRKQEYAITLFSEAAYSVERIASALLKRMILALKQPSENHHPIYIIFFVPL